MAHKLRDARVDSITASIVPGRDRRDRSISFFCPIQNRRSSPFSTTFLLTFAKRHHPNVA
ncbi:hypothetical protein TMatcc_009209 [Talaromyces marneffei ATCC 18224]